METYWHRVASLKEVGTYLVSRDIAPADVLRAQELPASLLLDSHAWIERNVCFELIAHIGRRSGDPYLGLHLAEVQRLQDYGPWAAGILQSPTLGAALVFAANRIGLIRTGLSVRIEPDGDRVVLAADFAGVRHASIPHPSLACTMTLLRIVRLVRQPFAVEARLCLSRPRVTDEAERLLGPLLTFGADRNELVFERQILDLPLPPPEPAAQEALGLLRTGQPLATARGAYQQIHDALANGRVTVVDVAHALNMSVRRLQRHLDRWGITFEAMLDEYRRRAALTHLMDGELPVTEIAFRLGYSDSAHFSRAVRRWTGQSPRQIRVAPDQALRRSIA